MPPSQVLLLDIDGVLITPADWFGLKIRREAPELATEFFATTFPAATRGELDLLNHVDPLIQEMGFRGNAKEFLDAWHRYEHEPNRELWSAVQEVRHLFTGVFVATNQEKHRTRFLMEEGGLGDYADGIFSSCQVGSRKPEARFYKTVTEHLGVDPEQIVFFDDSEENVTAAMEAGWSAHLYRDVPAFLQVVRTNENGRRSEDPLPSVWNP